MLTKEALRGAIIGTGLFDETEGCIELSETQPNDSKIGTKTVVFLDGEYQHACVYANAREGYIKRLKHAKGTTTKSLEGTETDQNIKDQKVETVKGNVLILFCSGKLLELLKQ